MSDSKGSASAALMELEVVLGLWGTPGTIETHVKELEERVEIAERERDKAEGEVERLRKALAPFAKAAERIPDFGPHAKAIEDILAVNWKDGSLPMFGTEFHRARAALEGKDS